MDTCTGWSKVRRDALVGLLLVLLQNLALAGLGLLVRGLAQRVAEARLNAFFLLPVGIWR